MDQTTTTPTSTYNYNKPNIKHPSSKTNEINKLIGAKELQVASATNKVLIGGFEISHLQHVISHRKNLIFLQPNGLLIKNNFTTFLQS